MQRHGVARRHSPPNALVAGERPSSAPSLPPPTPRPGYGEQSIPDEENAGGVRSASRQYPSLLVCSPQNEHDARAGGNEPWQDKSRSKLRLREHQIRTARSSS